MRMKRVLSFLMCIMLIVGLLPMGAIALAANDDIDYLFIATDRHANTSVIGNIINNMENNIGENELDYLGLGGDMVGSGNSHPAYNSSTVLSEVTNATTSLSASNVDIVAGIHDMNVTDDAGIVLPYQGGCAQIYEGDKYYVYGVEEYCISDDSNESNWKTQSQAFVDWANGDGIDKSKAIIVVSHYPLHAKRNDNDGAYYWHQALNSVATGGDETVERDIVFFHGHNHTVDSNEYVYNVGDTMSIQNGSSTTSDTIYYTYATAGYLNQNKKATLVSITDTEIKLEKYATSGSGTAMTTVTRVVTEEPAPTLASIAISGTTEYNVGDELALTVTAVYSDGTTADVTADAALSGHDMSAAGTYTVTASYEGLTATVEITVKAAEATVNTVEGWDDTEQVYIYATGLGLTELIATNSYGGYDQYYDMFTDHMAVDVELAGHTDGGEVEYKISIVENMDTTNLELYYVDENGSFIPVEFELVTDELDNIYAQFTTTYVGTFVYGSPVVPDGYAIESIELANIPADIFVGGALDLSDAEIKVTYVKDGAEDFVRMLTVYDYDENNFSGYDVNTVGPQTAVFTFEGFEAKLDVIVWGDEFTENDVTVHVGESDYGVNSVTVKNSENENVAGAVATLIDGDNYVAYDIELNFEEGYEVTDTVKTVTLPVPEGMTNPVVYYVSDNGTSVVNMNAKLSEDGKTVTFETAHFSTYVLGDGTTIETESSNATVEGSSTTTDKTVYVLTDTIAAGDEVIIVSSNSTSGYALGSDADSDISVTINSGALTVEGASGTYTYIEDPSTALKWTVGSGYTFTSGDYKLGATKTSYGSYYKSYDLTTSASANNASYNWTYSNYTLQDTANDSYAYYSRYYNDNYSSWTAGDSSQNVYIYKKVTATVTTGTVGHTYSVEGTDITNAVAIAGQTVTLSSVLYDTPDGGTKTDITASSGLTPTYEVVTTKGNSAVIKSIDENGVATLSGAAGTAVVKVTYTSGDLVAWDEFIVTATNIDDSEYTIDLTDGAPDYNSITAPITIKNIQQGMQSSLWAIVKAGETDLGDLGDKLTWVVSDEKIAKIDTKTGVITFTGEEGDVDVTVYYTCPGGKVIQDTATYSVTKGSYTVPEDGTDDFPEYPDPGAIRFDKHATAVGAFSETGIVQVELSMTGVPYGTDTAIDVVVMLDMTGSMSTNGMKAAEEATVAFVAKIVKNDDGTYNDNRVAVYAFNSGSSSPYELVSLGTISSDAELKTANTAIRTASDKKASGGTPFDEATEKCYNVLQAAKKDGIGNDRKQFCVFMSDGGPTAYRATYNNTNGYLDISNSGSGTSAITTYLSGYSSSDSSKWSYTLPTEYYTDLMKADGVTVYTVGLLLQNKPSNPSPYSSMTTSTYDSTTDSLTTIGSHYYFTSNILKAMASDTNKYIDIFNVDNASKATAAFESIAQSILDAATDVKVADKIADEYTMVFDAPNGTVADALPAGQELYIEVKDYVLNPVYGSDGTTVVDYTRGTAASLMKLYLGKSGTTYYAASDANGTAYAAPVFNQTAIGTMFYWTTDTNTSSGVSVTVDGTVYYFVEAGISSKDDDFDASKWYNMASGAYAFGNITTTDIVDDDTGEVTGTNSTCTDLIIATPYFVYNAKTRMLVWTVDKLSTSELALSYFLYLDKSGGYSGAKDETDPGTYETNDYAHLHYTNFQGTDCQQTMPVPQMTWNGAQVSYVFYLVNEDGQPVNRAGKVVPFSEAVYVTDVYTYSIVWNDLEQMASLEAEYLAEDLVPDVYKLYDEGAKYTIHVFEDEQEQNLNNHFVIEAGVTPYTTYVFNAKSDATKYKTPATYAATSTYKCKDYVAGGQYKDDKGTYNIVEKSGATIVETGFDFSNTTVAFAVVWKPELVPDAVVVDYGLDVVVNVITNDALAAGVVGVRADAPSGVTINNGKYDAAKSTAADIYIDANSDGDGLKELKIGTATVENLTSVRFSLDKTNGMQFTKPAEFYYETDVNYYVGEELKTESMYSSVTVIPASTIYYEDDFVTFTNSSYADGTYGVWSVDGTASSATQAVDRPGEGKISEAYDADNVYGYDGAYTNMSKYSMGASHKVTVAQGKSAMASFTFYGTGFDVISMTDTTSGMVLVQIFDASNTKIKSYAVNNYYGYAYDEENGWHTVDSNDPNALYQVPVIQIEDLTYGKYTVKLIASYNEINDVAKAGSYTFYLDAIRIYDPCGTDTAVDSDTTVSDVYTEDHEGWPVYREVRANVIAASDFTGDTINGAVFVDGNSETIAVSDYVSYGPNNELYLAPDQAVIFKLDLSAYGNKVDRVQLGMKSVDASGASYVIADGSKITDKEYLTGADSVTLTTATDMYYDITDLKDSVIVVYNSGSAGVLSLTDVKITFTEDPGTVGDVYYVDYDVISAVLENMNAEPAFEPTVTVDPESATAKTGEYVTITATTSADVEAVSFTASRAVSGGDPVEVDSNVISTYTVSGSNRVWTADVEVGNTAGDVTVDVVAYNGNGQGSEAKTVSVTVEEPTAEETVVQSIKNVISNLWNSFKSWFGW